MAIERPYAYAFVNLYQTEGRRACIDLQVLGGKSEASASRSVDRMKLWHIDGQRTGNARPGSDTSYLYRLAQVNKRQTSNHTTEPTSGDRLGLVTDDLPTADAYTNGFGGNPIFYYVWGEGAVQVWIAQDSDAADNQGTLQPVEDNSNLIGEFED